MKKIIVVSAVFIMMIVAIIITEMPTKRDGIDKQLAKDSLKVVEVIDHYNNEIHLRYDDLPEEDRSLIDNYDYDSYLNKKEKYSDKEQEIIELTMLAKASYFMNKKDIDGKVTDYDADIKQYKKSIEIITKDIVN